MKTPWQKRYRGIVISSAVFILLLVVMFGIQMFFVFTNNHNHAVQNKLTESIYHLMDLDKSVHNILLHMNEKPQEPLSETLLDGFNTQLQNIDGSVQQLKAGLDIYQYSFKLVPLHDLDQNNLITSIEQEWANVRSKIDRVPETGFLSDSTNRYQLIEAEEKIDLVTTHYRLLFNLTAQSIAYSDLAQNILMITRFLIAIGYFLLIAMIFVPRLRKEDQQLLQKQQDYEAILGSMNEGLFLLDLNFNISPQYSRALTRYINFKPRHQMNLYSILEDLVPKSQVQLLERFLKQVLNPRVKQNLISDLNPLNRVQVRNQQGEDRWLSFSFRRVIDSEQKVTAILASVRDTTDNIVTEKRLENEREHSDMQLEMLTAILRVDHSLLQSFIRNVVASANRMNNILRRPSLRTIDFRAKIEDLFREAHSLKSEASALDLRMFVNLTTKMEEKLQAMSKQEHLRGNDFFGFTIDLEDLMSNVERTEQLLKRLGGIKVDNAEQLAREINQVAENNSAGLAQYFQQFARNIAERQGKLVTVELSGFEQHHLTAEQLDHVKEILLQLVRNAVVHGIENPKHRKAIGKSPEGLIHIELNSQNDKFQINVSDDGAGINLEALREKAARMPEFTDIDVKSLSPKALYPVMFVQGFSTAVHVTEDAGHGVGMGVVRERIKALNGKLSIESEPSIHTQFTLQFSS